MTQLLFGSISAHFWQILFDTFWINPESYYTSSSTRRNVTAPNVWWVTVLYWLLVIQMELATGLYLALLCRTGSYGWYCEAHNLQHTFNCCHWMSICLSVYLTVCLSVCRYVWLCLFVCLSACLSVYMYVSCLSVCLSVCTYKCCLYVCLYVCLSACLSDVCLSVIFWRISINRFGSVSDILGQLESESIASW